MINSLIQYLKETRNELHHVAWPTQKQTILYTSVVVAFSLFVSLYLGLFDFIFTGMLTRAVTMVSSAPQVQVEQISTSTATTTAIQVTPSASTEEKLKLPALPDSSSQQ